MNFGLALLQMFPNVNPSQYELMMQSDGTVKITQWNVPGTPQPAEADVENFWNTGMMPYFRTQKKEQLSQQCGQVIIGGFTSNALGTAHTYPSDDEAQRNFNSEMHMFNIDPNYTSLFKTLDAGYLPHTKAQLLQVFSDGHTFKVNQLARLNGPLPNGLKAQVDEANTIDQINAIVW
jgi:hypothetical protein